VPPGTTVSILGNRVSGTIARLDPGVTVAFTYTNISLRRPSDDDQNGAIVTGTSLPGTNARRRDARAPPAADGERTGAGG
jgi:hypothetical protein